VNLGVFELAVTLKHRTGGPRAEVGRFVLTATWQSGCIREVTYRQRGRETENGTKQERTAECSRIPLLQSHVKNCVKLEIYDPLWVFLEPSWTFWLLNLGQICCPQRSVRNYHYALRNIPEERRSQLYRGGSLKSRIRKIGIRNFLKDFTRRSEFNAHELNYGSGVMLRHKEEGFRTYPIIPNHVLYLTAYRIAYHKQKVRHFYGRPAASTNVCVHGIKTYAEADPIASLNSTRHGGGCLASRPSRFPTEKKRYRHTLNRTVGGNLSRSECFGEKKNRMYLLGLEPGSLYGCQTCGIVYQKHVFVKNLPKSKRFLKYPRSSVFQYIIHILSLFLTSAVGNIQCIILVLLPARAIFIILSSQRSSWLWPHPITLGYFE